MRALWGAIKTHRRCAAGFAAFWLLVWVVMAATWFPPGEPDRSYVILRFFLSVLLPAVAGATAASWGVSGRLAGVLISEVNLVFLITCQQLADWMRPVPGYSPQIVWSDVLVGVLLFGALFFVIGFLFGALGAAVVKWRKRPLSTN